MAFLSTTHIVLPYNSSARNFTVDTKQQLGFTAVVRANYLRTYTRWAQPLA